jgi:hypothetical protein
MKSFFKQGLFFAIVIAFTACGGNYTYFLNTNNANGLEVGDPVYRQGVAIGEVEDVHFEGDEVQIEIAIEEPMYEGQYFSIRNTVSGHELDLAKPGKDANALAKDAVVRNDYFNGDLLEGLGEALGNSLGNTLGREGEELERSLEKLANRMEGFGENLGERISNQMERAGEGFGEAISNWAEGNEEELEELARKLERWADEHEAEFEAFGEEMEAWEEEFEGDADDFVKEMSHISDKHKVGSNAWKREVKELMRNQ